LGGQLGRNWAHANLGINQDMWGIRQDRLPPSIHR
jgi:hypothetical protein